MSGNRKPGLNDPLAPDLKTLPTLEPPRDVLPEILAALHRTPAARPRRRWLGWAAAAVLLVTAGTIALLAQRLDRQAQELSEWVRYSQRLETQLRLIGGRNAAVRGHRAAALGELEDRIAQVDFRLAQRPRPDEEIALWRRRAVLLHDLVGVHADDRLLAGAAARRPVVTLNPPLGPIPASGEL